LALSNISVSDAFTSGGTGSMSAITCQAATLAPGASTTCTATYVVSQADVDAGQVTNTAVASGTPPGNTTPTTSPPSTATVTAVAAPGLSVVKSASEASVSQVGDTIDYRFQVTNTGNVTLRHVRVVDGMAGLSPISCPTDTLAPSASETCTATYTVTQADIDAGALSNTAVSVARSPQSTPVTSDPSKATVPVTSDVAASAPAASALAFTGLPAVQLTLLGLIVLLLGVLLLAVRRRLASDE
jgi:uncharacterized repeat protein (TIGR01451 family)